MFLPNYPVLGRTPGFLLADSFVSTETILSVYPFHRVYYTTRIPRENHIVFVERLCYKSRYNCLDPVYCLRFSSLCYFDKSFPATKIWYALLVKPPLFLSKVVLILCITISASLGLRCSPAIHPLQDVVLQSNDHQVYDHSVPQF